MNGGANQIASEYARQRDASGASFLVSLLRASPATPDFPSPSIESRARKGRERRRSRTSRATPPPFRCRAPGTTSEIPALTGCSPTPTRPEECLLRRLEDDREGARAPTACPLPIRPHPDAEERPAREQHRVRRRKSSEHGEEREPEDGEHQRQLPPHRSAAVPAAAPPTRRNINVTVPNAPASALSTVKLR